MITRLSSLIKHPFTARLYFATATIGSINYYKMLGVQSGATSQEIHQAYKKVVSTINPSTNQQIFKSLSEAFVILTNSKSRDAYDSLIRVKNVTYLNETEEVPVSNKSYISMRRDQANRLIRKKLNIDEFGRYKGGLPKNNPQYIGTVRGSAAQMPGEMSTRVDIENYADQWPEFNIVDSEVAESFKNYHQKDRRYREAKQPFFTLKVDYDFFTFKTFRLKYLPALRIGAVILFILPTFYIFIHKHIKLLQQKDRRAGIKEKLAQH